ncbi:MAG: translation initiation factor IF-3 [Patescibacteria group bacterium]
MATQHRINNYIKAQEVRLLGPEGENMGVVSLALALDKSKEYGLDLVEISPNSIPPITKIVDYGKFLYAENKKQKQLKSKAKSLETKSIQVKVGTGENDLNMKAKKASEWLKEGHRVRVDLFLPGRIKYMDQKFLKERMERILNLISTDYNVAEEPKKSPKGLTAVIERAK